jgi:hypothetical protein
MDDLTTLPEASTTLPAAMAFFARDRLLLDTTPAVMARNPIPKVTAARKIAPVLPRSWGDSKNAKDPMRMFTIPSAPAQDLGPAPRAASAEVSALLMGRPAGAMFGP